MEVKHVKCPGCGASLDYNYKLRSYKCEYCGSTFIDEKDDKTHNPRVELTPDDLKKVDQQSYNSVGNFKHAGLVVTIVMLLFFLIPIIVFIAQTHIMFNEFANFDTMPY